MLRRILLLGCFFALACSLGWGQITNVTNDTSTPIPGAGHDYIKMLSETVNPANGSVSIRIGVPVPKGRGLTIPFAFAYDSNGAHFAQSFGAGRAGLPSNGTFLSKGGWTYSVPQLTEAVGQRVGQGRIPPTCDYYSDYVFQDTSGGRHALGIAVGQYGTPGCSQVPTVSVPSAGDDIVRASTSSLCSQCTGPPPPVSVADPDGTVFQFSSPGHDGGPPSSSVSGSLPTWIEDRNGNKITVSDSQNGVFSFTDTLGRTLLSSSGFGSTGNTLTVSGLPAYSVTWGTVPTNFAVSVKWLSSPGCAMGGDNETLPVITAIALPNGQSYRFQYDSTYGLLNKIIYPSGGYVRYAWGLNPLSAFAAFPDNETTPNPVGCQCIHDFPAVAHRYVSFDGSTEVEQQDFSYSTTWSGGGWTSKATTVTTHDLLRGGSFQTSYTYIPVTMPLPPNEHSYFAIQIPVESTVTNKDWSGSTIRTVTKNWVDQYKMQGQRVVDNGTTTSDQFFLFGAGGQITDKYECGSGQTCYNATQTSPPASYARHAKIQYASFSATPIFPYPSIVDRPSSIITYDGSGTRAAETDYTYDGPGLVSAGITVGRDPGYNGNSSVPRGNATQKTQWLNTGGSSPVTKYTYDDTGQMRSMTDPNNNLTEYDYADSFPPGNTNT